MMHPFPSLPLLLAPVFLFAWLTDANMWMEAIPRLGQVAFQPNANYPVFRNVKSYGAFGDGIHDDSDAINAAIAAPGQLGRFNLQRCGGGNSTTLSICTSSTIQPALVYFPPGNYTISKPLVMYWFTQMVGDATNLPNIYVRANFSNQLPILGSAVFESNVRITQAQWYQSTNQFYRQVRNFRLDLTAAPNGTVAVHWQVAQATSLQNLAITMRDKSSPGNQQVGIFMEDGSGGFFSDIVISGGYRGLSIGSQQFTSRNVTVSNASTAIFLIFDWIWTFAQITITNCDVGFDLTNGGFNNQVVSAVVLIDSVISATVGILSQYAPGYSGPQSGGTLMLERVDFTSSPTAIAVGTDPSSRVILAGGQYVNLFGQGNAWTTAGQALNGQAFNGTSCTFQNNSQTVRTAQELTIQRRLAPIQRPPVLTDPQGNIVARSRPQYEGVPATGFLSAKAFGLAGDGVTDDTLKMQLFFNQAANANQIAYLDKGAYVLSNTVQIPKDLKITGELQTIVMATNSAATGSNFGNQNSPKPMWRVGNPGESGTVEITDVVFEALGPVPGCVMVEWNIKQATPAGAGMWDANWRIGGSAGTNLQSDKCLKAPATAITTNSQQLATCTGTFLLLHVTPQADLYIENCWGWVADHDLDLGNRDQINIFNGRGFLIESANGPVWMWGTAAEHSTLYNYQFTNARNVWMGHTQHETAYFQGNPNALLPFTPQASWHDPDFAECAAELTPQLGCVRTWACRFVNCQKIFNYGAGYYNFFNNWDAPGCLSTESCQERMVDFINSTEIYIWGMSTKGSTYMVSWDHTSLVPQVVNKAGFTETVLLFEMVQDQ